jgi:hypothetical protein
MYAVDRDLFFPWGKEAPSFFPQGKKRSKEKGGEKNSTFFSPGGKSGEKNSTFFSPGGKS